MVLVSVSRSEKPLKPFAIASSLDVPSWAWLRRLRVLSCTRPLLAALSLAVQLLHARRANPKLLAILLCCWTVFGLQDAPNAFVKKSDDELASRPSLMVELLLKRFSRLARELNLKGQAQLAHAQILGEILLQCPLPRLYLLKLLVHPRSQQASHFTSSRLAEL